MQQKRCIKCSRRRLIKFFYKTNSVTCKDCLNQYQLEYYAKKRQSGDFHKPRIFGVKICKNCEEEKDVNQFPISILSIGGRTSVCCKCNYQKYKGRIKQRVAYAKTHPAKWKKYYNDYKKKYRCDPFANKRVNLAVRVWREKIKPEENTICHCGNTGKLLAFIPDQLVYKGLKFDISNEELSNSIIWMCRPCIYKKRKTRD